MINDFKNWDMLNKIRHINFEEGKFEANGTTYYLETKLTVSRFCEFIILEKELATGMSLKELYDGVIGFRKLLNDVRFVDCATFCDKIIMNCVNLKMKEPPVMKICALFINTENEDRSTWNNDVVVKKMADWKASDIDVHDFFVIALTLVPTFIGLYNKLTQNILSQMDVAEEIISAVTKIPKGSIS